MKIFLTASLVKTSQKQLSCNLNGEVVLLELRSGVYYGLNASGSVIWKLIQKETTVGQILETLLKKYDVAPDRCERDLCALLQDLCAAGLIEIQDAKTGQTSKPVRY